MKKSAGTIIGILGLLIGLIALGYAWYEHKSKEPCYAYKGANLVSASVSSYGPLEVSFEKKAVPQVTVTNICFWNAGRDSIRRGDIIEGDALRLVGRHGAKILSCQRVRSKRPKAIGASIQDPRKFPQPALSFDLLDKGDWILVQVIHTGRVPTTAS